MFRRGATPHWQTYAHLSQLRLAVGRWAPPVLLPMSGDSPLPQAIRVCQHHCRDGGIVMKLVVGILLLSAAIGSCSRSSSTSTDTSGAVSHTSASASGMVSDPAGDVGGAPEFLDLLGAGVSEADDTFTFTFTLAEPVPASFEVPKGWDGLLWSFCLDTDASRTPTGYPFNGGTPAPCEYIVAAVSTGRRVTGLVLERGSGATGEDRTSAPVVADGANLTVSVPAESLGTPTRFTWVAAGTELALPWPNDLFADVDEVPDASFAGPAPWPAAS